MSAALQPYTLRDFDFALPPELIAQHPASERSAARLLDGRDAHAQPVDRIVRELPGLLRAGDLLVCNDTQVIKARLFVRKPSGGRGELLVERVLSDGSVVAHLRLSRKPASGSVLELMNPAGDAAAQAVVLGRWPDADGPLWHMRWDDGAGSDPYTLMQRLGHVPLPPYITHSDSAEDVQRYQTVFARQPGAVAAPTAALHFDDALLQALQAAGVQRAHVTLHVGAGTFAPIKHQDLSQHTMHHERYDVPLATQQAVAATRARGGRVLAVGTTSVRALESWARGMGASGDTALYIRPGFEFRVVDLLLTNFHLPKSSLLLLVSAFAGYHHMRTLYDVAIARRYRFFSYGDAMLLARD